LLPLPLSSSLPASLIAIAITHIVAIALVAIACLPHLPSPSLSHTTLVANAMALAALALVVARHPHSSLPLLPLLSLLLSSTSAVLSHCLLLPAIVVVWLSTVFCQPPPTFDAPIAS
jgi:hypothetical protein